MNRLKMALAILTSQIKRSDVTLQVIEKPHKIQDDNQSIHNGVVNEKSNTDLRSAGETVTVRRRGRKPKRKD